MPIGGKVKAMVKVTGTIRRQITFFFQVVKQGDEDFVVASGTHQRAYVDVHAMAEQLKSKSPEKVLKARDKYNDAKHR